MVSPVSLTRRQQDLLRFIAGYQRAHDGISPSYAEMAKGIGAPSNSVVAWLIDKLEQRGHLRRLRNRYRAIEVMTPVAVPRAPDGAPLFAVPMPEARR